MLTKKGYTDLLQRIMEKGGMGDDLEQDVGRLRADLDEREGVLSRYGEGYDGELDDYDWKEKETPDYAAELDALQGKYDDLVRRYNAKYFAGGDAHKGDNTYEYGDKGRETIQNSSQDVTVNDLLVDIK